MTITELKRTLETEREKHTTLCDQLGELVGDTTGAFEFLLELCEYQMGRVEMALEKYSLALASVHPHAVLIPDPYAGKTPGMVMEAF